MSLLFVALLVAIDNFKPGQERSLELEPMYSCFSAGDVGNYIKPLFVDRMTFSDNDLSRAFADSPILPFDQLS